MKIITILLAITITLFASIESEINKERFIKTNNTIYDKWTNITWQDNSDVGKIRTNWHKAKKICEKLVLEGKTKWRLPTTPELKSSFNIKFRNSIYENWSSTLNSKGHGVHSMSGQRLTRNSADGNWNAFRCVKGKKYIELATLKNNIQIHQSNKANEKSLKYLEVAKSKNTIQSFEHFIKEYHDATNIKEAKKLLSNLYLRKYEKEYELSKNINSIKSYANFISNFPNSPQAKEAQQNIYQIAYNKTKKLNSINSYIDFIKEYPNAPQVKEAFQNSYNIAKSKNTIVALLDYMTKEVPKTNILDKANFLEDDYFKTIYSHIVNQNNIAGYEWFIKTYPNAQQVKEAIETIHTLAYNKAKSINTVSAYNTFIMAYPYAKQVQDANDKAYKLEEKEYTDIGMMGFFGKEEKLDRKGRELLNRAKMIERQANDKSYDTKAGYTLIANRMYTLLQDRFISSDATTRYLESQEFKDFMQTFKSVMRDIGYKLDNIANYSSQMIEVSKQGFQDASADREMSRHQDEEHHKWEKRMHLREKGYY